MSRPVRTTLALVMLPALALLTAWAVTELPDFGHPRGPYATAAVRLSLEQRHVTNAVSGVTFDIRGIDTLGEELILFCAAIGATVLLRSQRAAQGDGDRSGGSGPRVAGPLRSTGAALVGPVLVLGVYLVAHGQLTPGGGFQGGVVLAAGLLLVYAAAQLRGVERVRPVPLVELTEAVGAGAFALVALGGLVFAVAAMANFLPLGTVGSLLSGGTIPVLSVAVGVEVAGAITLIVSEFLDQALARGPS